MSTNKTNRQIMESLLHLMIKKQFNNISITDIAEHADISRSTFYSYYEDKYELLEAIEEYLINGFIQIMLRVREYGSNNFYNDIKNGHCNFFVDYFSYIKQHGFEFKSLLVYDNSTGFTSRFSRAITKTRINTLVAWHRYPNIKVVSNNTIMIYREEVLSSLYISLFTTWLQRDFDLSEEKMSFMLAQTWMPLTNLHV